MAEPSADLVVFLGDCAVDGLLAGLPDLKIIPAADMGIRDFNGRTRRYSAFEFNASLKAAGFDYCFDELGYRRAIYLDSDIYVLRSLDHVYRSFDRGVSCIMTPHITEPIKTGLAYPSDFDILKAGICNSGFLAFANVPESRAFLTWWGQKCHAECILDLERGIFLDQRYCDMACAFISNFELLRHGGYNLAYWNLMHRPVSQVKGVLLAGKCPVHFVHFSGIDLARPEIFSRYQTQFSRGNLNGLEAVYEEYIALLAANDRFPGGRYSDYPYGFGPSDPAKSGG